jgi:bile acid-coenzyme A ligase
MLVPAADNSGTVPIGQRIADLGAERGEAAAVISGNGSISWASLDRQSNRVARALASRGAGNGTFLTIALPNGIDFIVASVACWKLGAIPQPVSAKLPDLELQAIIGLADPPVVLADQALTAARPVCDVATLLGEPGDIGGIPAGADLTVVEGADLGGQHRPSQADRRRPARCSHAASGPAMAA